MSKIFASHSNQAGFSMLEVLVSMVIAGLVTVGIALNQGTALRIGKMTEVHFAASTLASGKVEELAAIDPLDLDDSFDETDTVVNYPELDIVFLRTTDITINADNSRTIQVTVASDHDSFPSRVSFETTLSLWE